MAKTLGGKHNVPRDKPSTGGDLSSGEKTRGLIPTSHDEKASLSPEVRSSKPTSVHPTRVQAERAALIETTCGKYAWVQTSSDEFAQRKQAEIERER
jgi:hypothetical protein